MKKLLGLLVIGLMVIGLAGPAAADYTYNFTMGTESNFGGPALDDNGLEMWAEIDSGLAGTTFSLVSGASWTLDFGTIGPDESYVNSGDDEEWQQIIAYIDFADPNVEASIGGNTVGVRGWFFGYPQSWKLVWDGPVDISFGDGNWMTLELNDITGDFGCHSVGNLDLTVTYSHVPVPAAVWLLGSGLVGLAGLRRKFSK